MKLDNKYFIPFILLMAVMTALLIAFFTVNSQKSQRRAFERRIIKQDSLKFEQMPVIGDTSVISVQSYRGKYVILDFWATWSNYTEQVHGQLARLAMDHQDSLRVVAAAVQDKRGRLDEYMKYNDFPFTYVEGSRVFNSYHFPGLPVQIIYSPGGEIIDIYFGFNNETQYDSLRSLLNDGQS